MQNKPVRFCVDTKSDYAYSVYVICASVTYNWREESKIYASAQPVKVSVTSHLRRIHDIRRPLHTIGEKNPQNAYQK
jgi:hypothetical protein